MKKKSWTRLFTVVAAAGWLAAGCGSPDDGSGGPDGSAGSSGTTGSAGASGSAGTMGTGGTTGTGGSAGTTGGTSPAGGRGGAAGSIGGSGPGTGGSGGGVAGSGAGGSGTGGSGTGGRGGAGGTTSGTAGAGGSGVGGAGGGGRGGGGGSHGGAGGTAGGGGTGTGGSGTFDPCPPAGTACKILPLGDSITFGINYEGSYRVELFTKAVGANKKITYVGSTTNGPTTAAGMTFPRNHEGHSGFTIDQMRPFVMTTDVPYMPNMILLHIGTNDTYMMPSGSTTRLASLVDLILSTYPNALLVIAKIIPYPSQMANVNMINNSIPDLVSSRAAMGKHILMVDLNTGFNVQTMLSSDTIHPNMTGYNWMGDQWYTVVGSYLH